MAHAPEHSPVVHMYGPDEPLTNTPVVSVVAMDGSAGAQISRPGQTLEPFFLLTVCSVLAGERPPRSWPEQVLPYGLATMMPVTPYRWTLTETSREVRLPLSPP